MRIAIVTDMPRITYLPGEEGQREDHQKRETVEDLKNVLSKKYDCVDMVFTENIIPKLRKENVDLVFNLCNGIRGDTKLAQLPAFLEFAGIPYTGSSIIGHTLAYNKNCACKIFKNSGITTPDFWSVYDVQELEDVNIKFPVIVKPNDEGSSRGIHQDSLVFDKKSLLSKVAEELEKYNPPIMISEFIDGREFSVGIVGNGEDMTFLPIVEVSFEDLPSHLLKFYSFEVKAHHKKDTRYYCPANISDELREKIQKTAKRAYESLMLRDYARIDIRVKDGIPYVLEINSLPGLMREFSLFTRMAEASIGYDGLIMKIVESALKRYNFSEETGFQTFLMASE